MMPNWLAMGLPTLTRLPLEKMFIRKPDPMESVKKLESLLDKVNTDSSPRAMRELSSPVGEISRSEGANNDSLMVISG